MTVDKSIRKTQKAIETALNTSGLSFGIMELILVNILNIVRQEADKALLEEPEDPVERTDNGTQ